MTGERVSRTIPGPYGTEGRPAGLIGGMLACRVVPVLPADDELDEDASNEHDAWGGA